MENGSFPELSKPWSSGLKKSNGASDSNLKKTKLELTTDCTVYSVEKVYLLHVL